MKKFFLTLVCAIFAFLPMDAQTTMNDNGDNLIGEYQGSQEGYLFRTRVTKKTDGTYKIQVSWMQNDKDANGNKLLDIKNPDKSLRNTPSDRIVIVDGLKYNAKKKRWDDAKIYDPTRGIKAKCTAQFSKDDELKIRGSVMGIGETVTWKKIK